MHSVIISIVESLSWIETLKFQPPLQRFPLLVKLKIFVHSSLALVYLHQTYPNWIKFDYLHIKKFACLYLGNEDMYPKFGKIVDAFTMPNNTSKPSYAVRIQHFETLYYDSHFAAYAVNLLSSFSILLLTSLPPFPLFHSHKAFNSSVTYIILKQYVM